MDEIILTEESVSLITTAIIKRAADDYRMCRANLRRKDLSEVQRLYYTKLKGDAETFFKSQWYYFLGGEEWMWKQMKRECDRGFFRKGTWDESRIN